MTPISYEGLPKVEALINSGLRLDQICDRYGRSVHPDADEFLRVHRQAKRLLLKHLIQTHNNIHMPLIARRIAEPLLQRFARQD